jgi:tryptophan halogenase
MSNTINNIVIIGGGNAGQVSGDFFVDCSGTKPLLIGEALKVPLKPFTDTILTNHVVFMQVPHPDENSEIVPCTISIAHECGWTWNISLANRRGVGYVYSDKYYNHERAEQVLRDYIGEQAQELAAKKVKVNVGQREKSFHKNCLALGMAAAFIEPLEASAIFLMGAGSNMLADLFPRNRNALAQVEKRLMSRLIIVGHVRSTLSQCITTYLSVMIVIFGETIESYQQCHNQLLMS